MTAHKRGGSADDLRIYLEPPKSPRIHSPRCFTCGHRQDAHAGLVGRCDAPEFVDSVRAFVCKCATFTVTP